MFTSLSSYIWGGSAAESNENSASESAVTDSAATAAPATNRPPRDPSPFEGGEDWVLIGGAHPAPGNLSTALEPLPRTSSLGSSPASSVGEDDEEEDNNASDSATAAVTTSAPAAVATRLPSAPVRGHADLALLAEARAVRAGQAAKQRAAGKAASSKALKRTNLIAAASSGRHHGKQAAVGRHNLSLKMAGASRNLKQC